MSFYAKNRAKVVKDITEHEIARNHQLHLPADTFSPMVSMRDFMVKSNPAICVLDGGCRSKDSYYGVDVSQTA